MITVSESRGPHASRTMRWNAYHTNCVSMSWPPACALASPEWKFRNSPGVRGNVLDSTRVSQEFELVLKIPLLRTMGRNDGRSTTKRYDTQYNIYFATRPEKALNAYLDDFAPHIETRLLVISLR